MNGSDLQHLTIYKNVCFISSGSCFLPPAHQRTSKDVLNAYCQYVETSRLLNRCANIAVEFLNAIRTLIADLFTSLTYHERTNLNALTSSKCLLLQAYVVIILTRRAMASLQNWSFFLSENRIFVCVCVCVAARSLSLLRVIERKGLVGLRTMCW